MEKAVGVIAAVSVGEYLGANVANIQGVIQQLQTAISVPATAVQLTIVPCFVRGQRLELDMIFRNLIDNAIKYLKSGMPGEVRTREPPSVDRFLENQLSSLPGQISSGRRAWPLAIASWDSV